MQRTPKRRQGVRITLEKIAEKIPTGYQNNVDAFVRDVRDLFGLAYWRCPSKSKERSVVVSLSKLFESRLLIGLRGPRVSPRQISRGYRGPPATKKKKEVHCPSFKRINDEEHNNQRTVSFVRPVRFIRFESVKRSYTENEEDRAERAAHAKDRNIFNEVPEMRVPKPKKLKRPRSSSPAFSSDDDDDADDVPIALAEEVGDEDFFTENVAIDTVAPPTIMPPLPSTMSPEELNKSTATMMKLMARNRAANAMKMPSSSTSFTEQCMQAAVAAALVAARKTTSVRTRETASAPRRIRKKQRKRKSESPPLLAKPHSASATSDEDEGVSMSSAAKNQDGGDRVERVWKKIGSKYIGTRILREFEGFDKMFWATITAFSPAQGTFLFSRPRSFRVE